MTRTYTITELTEAFDVTARTLRYYEEVGLLQPERSGLQRVYSERDRVRMGLILRGRRLGFSLQDIQEMLSLYDADPTEVVQLRDVIGRGDARLREVEEQIRDLTALRDELLAMRGKLEQTLAKRLQNGRGE
ncbi:MerR family transcriptional regulator [Alicyclobacillus sp. ALC3]|uniref:MerR family transcriptional regulator n=1 Tax=Alicyclobacillus sp. ALC3 TaxID=2796143 RepID=UPI0023784BD9|nr:MerR family DNA-binding transcriptional regulator [Alicyclobacillus sp. ALC3]WDL99079.1 MerR family DNA-binding transcriptional regulator [Alicyclobacillus sp. ALC3]